ncbi:hypothetical protein CHLRE_17g726000v5 [Chlamydomonas reinhardtii]|uniref:tRNA nucleotidyltransferase/poly(A) polymerase RNA and SrmB- binding domain-containing protein n=1 Tax=Chlamydomonas reinhardtii TaxID=3055 RepID=A0A2K3CQM4_CHLRE|nr:uncharacterized protein CHLRE_17g726000v5 [Chlamydomonas reinhardtii]PNW70586.1 hypothetical protein CHLRE_17g726000v5 [Chlamydomonas reinhardtii]
MFNGPAPVEAVRLLHRLGLFPTVFALPPPLDARLGTGYGGPCVTTMAAADANARALGLEMDKEERRFLLLAALLLPLRGLQHQPPKGKPVPATAALIRDALKWRVKDIEMSAALAEAAVELAAAHAVLVKGAAEGQAAAADGGAEPDVRIMLGQVIRKLKQHWKLGVALAPVVLTHAAEPLGVAGGSGAVAAAETADGEGELSAAAEEARLEMARALLAAVEAYGLSECWTWKPLMDGKKVMTLLGWSKPGPELGKVLAAVVDWQLQHPAGSLAEAEAMVRLRFGADCAAEV